MSLVEILSDEKGREEGSIMPVINGLILL